jgi:hypothetical protein
VRLNVITLLKTAGLTLAQIAGLMGPGTQDPDLRPMLSIQLENWRAPAVRTRSAVSASPRRPSLGP